MRRLSSHEFSVLLVIATILHVPAALLSQAKAVLPPINSYALDKSKVTIPADLTGSQNVLVLYFEPDQSDAARAWSQALEGIRASSPGMGSYILPVYPRENFLFRWWIDASIRSGAPASQNQRTTIPIFVDKKDFLRALDITNEKEPVVLLLDKVGRVEWKDQGRLNGTRLANLAAALKAETHSLLVNHAVMNAAGGDRHSGRR